MNAQHELITLVVRAADELGIDIMLIGAWARVCLDFGSLNSIKHGMAERMISAFAKSGA